MTPKIDEAVPKHPVVVNHRGGHTSWYNTKALVLAGITRQVRDPEHGRFSRDESGDLTGRVAELARAVFDRVGNRQAFTPEQARERAKNGMTHISALLAAAGLTMVHDAGAGRAGSATPQLHSDTSAGCGASVKSALSGAVLRGTGSRPISSAERNTGVIADAEPEFKLGLYRPSSAGDKNG